MNNINDKFESKYFCSNSQKLYDSCIEYYSNPNIRQMEYCRNKVDLYILDCKNNLDIKNER